MRFARTGILEEEIFDSFGGGAFIASDDGANCFRGDLNLPVSLELSFICLSMLMIACMWLGMMMNSSRLMLSQILADSSHSS